jgi:hypothetical protein
MENNIINYILLEYSYYLLLTKIWFPRKRAHRILAEE